MQAINFKDFFRCPEYKFIRTEVKGFNNGIKKKLPDFEPTMIGHLNDIEPIIQEKPVGTTDQRKIIHWA